MDKVNEKSNVKLTLTFRDEDGDAVTPDSASYRIDDEFSGDAVKADTAISPSSSTYDIVISSTENAIIDTNRVEEIKLVTVDFTYDTTKKGSGSFNYKVINLKQLS